MQKVSYLDKMMGLSSNYNTWIDAVNKLCAGLEKSEKLVMCINPDKPNTCIIKNNISGEHGTVSLLPITTGITGIELTATTYSMLLKSDMSVSVFIPYDATVLEAAMSAGGAITSIERSVQLTYIALSPAAIPRTLTRLECGTPIIDKTIKLLLGHVYFDNILYAFQTK